MPAILFSFAVVRTQAGRIAETYRPCGAGLPPAGPTSGRALTKRLCLSPGRASACISLAQP